MKVKLLFILFLLTLLSQGVEAKTTLGSSGQCFEDVKNGSSNDVTTFCSLSGDQNSIDWVAGDIGGYHLNSLLIMMQHAKVKQMKQLQLMGKSCNINTKSLMKEKIQ